MLFLRKRIILNELNGLYFQKQHNSHKIEISHKPKIIYEPRKFKICCTLPLFTNLFSGSVAYLTLFRVNCLWWNKKHKRTSSRRTQKTLKITITTRGAMTKNVFSHHQRHQLNIIILIIIYHHRGLVTFTPSRRC